ncbi:MAG: hypothetical protein QM541_07195 [Flavobacterium sp.]|nr:hypothetical protein [Flavobacterium sp.]
MNPKEYIQKSISNLANQFPNIEFKCGIDKCIGSYIVQITPASEFDNNDALLDAWIPISLEFNELFINDEIVFTSQVDTILEISEEIKTFNAISFTDKMKNIFSYTKLPIQQQDAVLVLHKLSIKSATNTDKYYQSNPSTLYQMAA